MAKTCTKCKKVKPLSKYHYRNRGKGTVDTICKTCTALGRKKYYLTKHARAVCRKSSRKRLYGLTNSEFDKMLTDQKGCCAICGKHQTEAKKVFSVDHNHETKELRGLLCMNCNLLLGHAKENTETLQSAIDYLRRFTNG